MIDLQPFCDDESRRFAIGAPWEKDGKHYATDGRICIRVDVGVVATYEQHEGKHPNVDKALERIDRVTEWETLEPIAVCRKCNGVGRVDLECDNCVGSGECECRCETFHACGFCDGKGKINSMCPACEKPVRLMGRNIRTHYAWLMSQLPGVEIGAERMVKITDKTSDEDAMLCFRFSGGCGAVMPIVD